jgi:hypothetical protein
MEYEKQRCEEAEKLYTAIEIRQFYQNTNSMRKGFTPNNLLCKDKWGIIIAEIVDTLERWAQHLENNIHPSELFEENVELSTSWPLRS